MISKGTKNFSELRNISLNKGDQITALNTNLHHTINLLLKIFITTSHKRFNGQHSTMLISPLKSIDFVNFKKSKVLSVGPRVRYDIQSGWTWF